MTQVFADTSYWIARFNKMDSRSASARAAREQVGSAQVITTEEVLVEFLNHFAGTDPLVRCESLLFVRDLLIAPGVEVIRQSHESFLAGLGLYESRPDKGYSLTDCISMTAMRERGIRSVLTADRHFSQEGFTALMKPAS
jgi:uncharacterized protein